MVRDLVTMAWWDDIWLNESFASWMAAKETARRNPSWKWWEAADADKERAMGADARVTSHAIEQHATDELQATNSVDPQITYDKGHSILRMLEAYLGEAVFRDGMAYMQAFAYSNATTADLWQALSRSSGRDLEAIAAGWTAQPDETPDVRTLRTTLIGELGTQGQRKIIDGGARSRPRRTGRQDPAVAGDSDAGRPAAADHADPASVGTLGRRLGAVGASAPATG